MESVGKCCTKKQKNFKKNLTPHLDLEGCALKFPTEGAMTLH